jgi:hypothetical protein
MEMNSESTPLHNRYLMLKLEELNLQALTEKKLHMEMVEREDERAAASRECTLSGYKDGMNTWEQEDLVNKLEKMVSAMHLPVELRAALDDIARDDKKSTWVQQYIDISCSAVGAGLQTRLTFKDLLDKSAPKSNDELDTLRETMILAANLFVDDHAVTAFNSRWERLHDVFEFFVLAASDMCYIYKRAKLRAVWQTALAQTIREIGLRATWKNARQTDGL